jgi:hypothetical protein
MSDDQICPRCDTPIEAGDRMLRYPLPHSAENVMVHEACVIVGRKDHVGMTPDADYRGRYNEDADGEWEWDDDTPIKPDQ